MRPEDFSERSSGRLVRTLDGQLLAFVPNPLPQHMPLREATQDLLIGAADAIGELRGVSRMLTNPTLVIAPFVRREAVLSSRIEGTTAGLADLVMFEATGHVAVDQPDDVREVLNYQRALFIGLDLLERIPISNRLIRLVHEQLLQDVRGQDKRPGEFRAIQNAISARGTGLHAARFIPPPVREMGLAMNEIETFIGARHTSIPLLVQLAMIHYQFEAIHPFMDGNGRLGRLLIPLIIHERGYLPSPLLYVSAYLERHRDAYKDHLLAVSQHGAWDDWIAFFLIGIRDQSIAAIQMADRLLAVQKDYKARIVAPRASIHLASLVDMLIEQPAVTARQVMDRLSISRRSAYDQITRLVQLEILVAPPGNTHHAAYLAPGVLRAISPEEGQIAGTGATN